jgi:hypothetical protein
MIGYAAVLPLSMICMSSSWADNCTGYSTSVTQSAETTDLGKGVKQTAWKSATVVMSNDSIYNLVTGECVGITLQTEEGKMQTMGYCSRRDKDGDTYSIAVHRPLGADKGQWNSVGGTGKFAGKQDSGWYQNVLVDGKTSVGKWGGDCK